MESRFSLRHGAQDDPRTDTRTAAFMPLVQIPYASGSNWERRDRGTDPLPVEIPEARTKTKTVRTIPAGSSPSSGSLSMPLSGTIISPVMRQTNADLVAQLTAIKDRTSTELKEKLTGQVVPSVTVAGVLSTITGASLAKPVAAALAAAPAAASVSTASPTATPGATAAPGATVNVGPEVSFSPFRINIWKRGDAGPSGDTLTAVLNNQTLLVGRYLLTFSVPAGGSFPFVAMTNPVPLSVEGKKVILEKAYHNPATGRLQLQLNIVENPIPLLILIGVAAAGVGAAGWGLSESLDSVDKIVVDTGKILPLVIAGGLLFLWFRSRGRS